MAVININHENKTDKGSTDDKSQTVLKPSAAHSESGHGKNTPPEKAAEARRPNRRNTRKSAPTAANKPTAQKPKNQKPARKTTNQGVSGQNATGQKNNAENSLLKNIYGAIDLGTNNCRLLIAQQTADGFKVIDSFSRIVRLGEGLGASTILSKEAIDRTIEALDICVAKIKRRGVTHSRNVATQACREAINCEEFIERVEKEVRIKLQIISPAEEARLAVMGCKALLDKKFSRAVVFDIGGGSTEVIWVKINPSGMPEILDWISIPFGVVNLSEKYGTIETISEQQYSEMKRIILDEITAFEEKNDTRALTQAGKVQLLGTSGTITTLTAMHLELDVYDRNRVDGAWIKSSHIRGLCEKLSVLNYKERASLKSIGEDRADLVVAGCAILESIMDLWPINEIRVADRGIREGMLLEMIEAAKNKNKNRNRRRNRNRSNMHRKTLNDNTRTKPNNETAENRKDGDGSQ